MHEVRRRECGKKAACLHSSENEAATMAKYFQVGKGCIFLHLVGWSKDEENVIISNRGGMEMKKRGTSVDSIFTKSMVPKTSQYSFSDRLKN